MAEYVKSPAGDSAGELFMPTLEQARFILWFYAVDEEGKYITEIVCSGELKAPAKDTLAAALPLRSCVVLSSLTSLLRANPLESLNTLRGFKLWLSRRNKQKILCRCFL